MFQRMTKLTDPLTNTENRTSFRFSWFFDNHDFPNHKIINSVALYPIKEGEMDAWFHLETRSVSPPPQHRNSIVTSFLDGKPIVNSHFAEIHVYKPIS